MEKKACIVDIKRKFRKKCLRHPSIDFDFCNISSSSNSGQFSYPLPNMVHPHSLYRVVVPATLDSMSHSSQLRLIPYLHHTSSVLRQLPLELLSEIFNEGVIKIISLSNIRLIIIYFDSSQCRLIPYLHQRPIFFKANSIHSSIVAILELIRGAQCMIEVIRSSDEEM